MKRQFLFIHIKRYPETEDDVVSSDFIGEAVKHSSFPWIALLHHTGHVRFTNDLQIPSISRAFLRPRLGLVRSFSARVQGCSTLLAIISGGLALLVLPAILN